MNTHGPVFFTYQAALWAVLLRWSWPVVPSTLRLVSMALIGTGLIAATVWSLIRRGWDPGQGILNRLETRLRARWLRFYREMVKWTRPPPMNATSARCNAANDPRYEWSCEFPNLYLNPRLLSQTLPGSIESYWQNRELQATTER